MIYKEIITSFYRVVNWLWRCFRKYKSLLTTTNH